MQFLKLATFASMPLLILSCTQPVDDTSSIDDSASVEVTQTQTQDDTETQVDNQAPTASPTNAVNQNVVTFTANAQDPENEALTYDWQFGDETSSNEANPVHTYIVGGTYTAILTVTDGNGKSVVTSTSVTVDTQVAENLAPVIAPASDISGNKVEFTANASDPEGGVLTYLWTFSDNTTSDEENPVHTFNTSGDHYAQLVVTDVAQKVTTVLLPVAIADFTPVIAPALVISENTVTFTANASDPENSLLTYAWTFSDGQSSSQANPAIVFNTSGAHFATLIVSDSAQNEVTENLTFTIADLVPVADFSYTENGLMISVDASLSNDLADDTLTYEWNFNSEASDNNLISTHTFDSSGDKTVTLTVTDVAQNQTMITKVINVSTEENLSPASNITFTVSDLTVSVDGSMSTDPEDDELSYAWNFNDEGASDLESTSFEFETPGNKVIQLLVTDSAGNTNLNFVNVLVSLPINLAPVAVINASVLDLTVTVDALSSTDPENDVLTYIWNFNNEGASDEVSTSFVFDSAGMKNIELTVTDSENNSTVITQRVNVTLPVNLAPTASFIASSDDLTVAVDASNSSDPENDALTYAWDFNGEGSADTQFASFDFSVEGEKTITLTVTDSANNQSQSVSQTITIAQPENITPVSYFVYTEQAQADTYLFNAQAIDLDSSELTYVWTDNSMEVSTQSTFTSTLVGDGYHTIELTVSDGNSSHSYSVSILVGEATSAPQSANLNLDLPKEYSLKNNGDILEMGGNYESGFYDDSTIEDIYIEFSNDNWATTLASNYDSETFESATLTYQGEVFSQVGVRYRGNTSYQRAGEKKSFAVELDWLIEGQDIDGYNFLKLNNAYEDPSNIREVLYNNIITDHIPSAKGSFVNVYVNGENYGVFANVQKLDKDHTKEWFFDKDSTRWRAEEPNGTDPGFHAGDSTLNNKGSQGADYESFYTLKGTTDAVDPWQNLADAAYTLGTASQDTIVDDLNPYFDIDAALWFLAVENLFTDDDGYINKGSMDYFVYLDVTTNRIMPIEFDGNSILIDGHVDGEEGEEEEEMTGPGGGGGGPGGGAAASVWTPFHNEADTDYPLINILMANPELRQRYLAHYRTLVEESFDPTVVQAKIDDYYNLIQAHVGAAQVTEYTVAQFEADIESMKSLVQRRFDYVTQYSEMAVSGVEISQVIDSVDGTQSVRPTDTQSVLVEATLSSNVSTSQAFLYYGSGLVGTFEKIEMSDSNNDGVYDASIPAHEKAQFVRYYVEVIADDATNTATYSPIGAEHDVYIYQVQAAVAINSDVVINEIMSSNKTIIADELGEYEDWIELYNKSDQAIDLTGYSLTDEDTDLQRWMFPDGTSIAANSTLTIWIDDDESSLVGLHSNFKLSADGESIYLVTPSLAFADSVSFSESNDDESYARSPNGTGDFEWTTAPSYNQSNP